MPGDASIENRSATSPLCESWLATCQTFDSESHGDGGTTTGAETTTIGAASTTACLVFFDIGELAKPSECRRVVRALTDAAIATVNQLNAVYEAGETEGRAAVWVVENRTSKKTTSFSDNGQQRHIGTFKSCTSLQKLPIPTNREAADRENEIRHFRLSFQCHVLRPAQVRALEFTSSSRRVPKVTIHVVSSN
jgi:hypothetical protein